MKVFKKILLFSCLLGIMILAPRNLASAKTLVAPRDAKFTPTVFTQLTPKTTKVNIYVYQNTTLYIKNGSKLIAKKHFKTEGTKIVNIKKQAINSKIKFYLYNNSNKKKGSTVIKTVVKKAENQPLTAPKLKYSYGLLTIKGKIGCDIFIKYVENGQSSKWIKSGTILTKNGLTIMSKQFKNSDGYYYVKLKDLNGKTSTTTKLKVLKNNKTEISID